MNNVKHESSSRQSILWKFDMDTVRCLDILISIPFDTTLQHNEVVTRDVHPTSDQLQRQLQQQTVVNWNRQLHSSNDKLHWRISWEDLEDLLWRCTPCVLAEDLVDRIMNCEWREVWPARVMDPQTEALMPVSQTWKPTLISIAFMAVTASSSC